MKPLTSLELTAKINELELAKTKLETEKATLEKDLGDEKAKVTALEGEKATLEKDLGDEKAKVTALEAEKVSLMKEATDAKKLAEDEKALRETADTRAEEKLREIDAKNGGTLPPKSIQGGGAPGAKKEPDASATPREKLAAGFKVVGEES